MSLQLVWELFNSKQKIIIYQSHDLIIFQVLS